MSGAMKVGVSVSSFGEADPEPLELIKAAGFELLPNPYRRRLTESEICQFIAGLDGLVAGLEPLNRQVLACNRKLKALARVGIGLDNVDLEAATEQGIRVSNTPDGPTESVCEAVLTHLLALFRRLPEVNADMHAGRWTKRMGKGLHGSRITVVGFGRVGSRVATVLASLGCAIQVVDPYVDKSTAAPWPLVSLEEGLSTADAITLHASGTSQIIGREELSKVNQGCYLLNSARGALVDEAALLEALDSGRIGGVWFDAFWDEPYRGKLIGHPKAILSPHLATFTFQCRRSMEREAALNVIRDLRASES